jgi:ribonucleoside-diphosphate reductase alpha chain
MIPTETKAAFDSAAQYFAEPIQQFQFYDKYSRFDYAKGRRETWPETCDRAVTFLRDLIKLNAPHADAAQIITDAERQSLLNMQALPSMRTIAMAGEAATRQNVSTFNCAFLPIRDTRAYAEALLISMSGCGVGFSVEKKFIDQLPPVAKQHARTEDLAVHVVEDSTEGWCRALLLGLNTWFGGGDIDFDLTQLRPAGAVLRIKGGRASGPRPLAKLLAFARKTILNRQGSRLTPLDATAPCWRGAAHQRGPRIRSAAISSLVGICT